MNGDDRIVMEDSVFVSGLPDTVTESEIETFFGSIGVIKVKSFRVRYDMQTIDVTSSFIRLTRS